jgi:predicted porin
VQLQTSLGSITLGRQYSPVYVIEALNEPFGAYNANEPGFIYDNYTGTPSSGSGGNRWDNAVKLESTFGGLSLAGMVSAGEGATGTASVGRKEGLSASYGQGPFTVNGAWQQTRNGSGAKNHKVWTLGGTYAIGPAKLYLSYLDHKSDTSVQTNKVIALGASYAVTPAVDLVAGYYHDQQRDADGKKQMIAAMANYKLSKRTNIYLQADHGKLSGAYATNVFNQFAWPTGIDSRTSVTAGIRHVF